MNENENKTVTTEENNEKNNEKKGFKFPKIGFFGYLTIAACIKGAVSIVQAVCKKR